MEGVAPQGHGNSDISRLDGSHELNLSLKDVILNIPSFKILRWLLLCKLREKRSLDWCFLRFCPFFTLLVRSRSILRSSGIRLKILADLGKVVTGIGFFLNWIEITGVFKAVKGDFFAEMLSESLRGIAYLAIGIVP